MVEVFKKEYPLGVRFWAILHLVLGVLIYIRIETLITTYSQLNRSVPFTILFNATQSQIRTIYMFLCIYYVVLGVTTLLRSGAGWLFCIGEFVYLIILSLYEILDKVSLNDSVAVIKYIIPLILSGLMLWYFLTQKVRDYFQLGMKFPYKIFGIGIILGLAILVFQVIVYLL